MGFFKFDRKKEKKNRPSDSKERPDEKEASGQGECENRPPVHLALLQKGPHKEQKELPVPKDPEQQSSGERQARTVNDFVAKTKCRHQQGLKPTGPELVAFARYLGIDPVGQNDLMWIAEEALLAPLPREWTEHYDSSDRVFYYNNSTQTSSWTHPMESMYRDTYKAIVNFRSSSLTPRTMKQHLMPWQDEVMQLEMNVEEEIASWTEHTDTNGNPYYFNKTSQISTWTDPRPAICHALYIKLKMLDILSAHAGLSSTMVSSLLKYKNEGGSIPSSSPQRENARRSSDGSKDSKRLIPLRPDSVAEDEDEFDLNDKKKKHKKKKRKDGGLSHSQSEPASSFGAPMPPNPSSSDFGKPLSVDRLRGIDFQTDDEPSKQGRVRVKAGIRLLPLNGKDTVSELHPSSSLPSLFPTSLRCNQAADTTLTMLS